jgi:hypothetical protein
MAFFELNCKDVISVDLALSFRGDHLASLPNSAKFANSIMSM